MIQNLMLISPAFFGSRNLPILAKIPPFNFLLNGYINNLLKRENFAKLLEKVYLRKPEDYEIDSYLKPLLIKDTFKNVLYMLDVVEDVDFNPPAILSKIDMPILLIWGKKDSIVPLKNSYKFIKSIKDKKLIEIDDCGHNAMETHTDIVFESIMNFINFN
ncbi:MAG: 2-hydroxy-6-oxononadienedioate/2-hydroxy-6-oxononatrienedioate hydrolase [Candidatus Methanofastidiosum methylothiophilum]|uniref:2-hydroxy-6-oxononadienedioate/2-hydroxy-6-oxononatrienedioate hydrolase n=1 Tax=Candidatus Methanofastidiosum methylothiophilum TaxID=1705564 RepID=A0A150IHV0_9EURY|nr:MAG: 2-hydroxy-6-oxononadienedioate/2-hydroxy-6-oxononatrienedioate hydrolase [Candidatus Methanofastidiosum methylthiophilus]